MGFFDGIGHFLGTLFGGGGNDDEKKKQQQAVASKASASQPSLRVAQPGQNDDQSLSVAAPAAQNDVNIGAALKKVNGNNPSPKQVAAAATLKAMGGAPDPNYQSKDPGLIDYAAQAGKGIGSSLVKVGDAAAGGISHLANVISDPIVTAEYQNMVKKGEIDDATASQLENEAGIKAGFNINDSNPTVLRKVTGAVAGPTATILTAGAAPEAVGGIKLLSPARQVLRSAATGAALGAGFGGIQTLDQTDPLTLKKTAENVGLGAVSGAALGAVAPTVAKTVGGMVDHLRPERVEIAPGVTSGANAAHDLTEHNAGIAQAANIGSVLDTPAYLRNRLALPAPRENVAVPINEGTPEGNVLLNQAKQQITPTGVELRPAVPSKAIGLMDKTNSRIIDPQVIPGRPEAPVTTPGQNVIDIGAPKASVDPALLQKARNTAIAKATGTENVAPYTEAPGAAPVESLVKKIENPTGSSDTELLKTMNDLITHPDAPSTVKDWALGERDKLTGVADATSPASPGGPAPEATAAVAQNAPSPQPLKEVLPAAPGGGAAPNGFVPLEQQARAAAKAAEAPSVASSAGGTPAASSGWRQQLTEGLGAAREQSMADAQALSESRSQRAAKMAAATEGLTGQAATDARLAAMKGEMGHRGEYQGIGGDNADGIFNAAREEAQAKLPGKDEGYTLTNLENALSRAIKGKGIDDVVGAPTDAQINLIKEHFGDDVAATVKKAVDDSRSFWQKAGDIGTSTIGAQKAVQTSMDFGASLRQAGVLATRFPKQFAHAFTEQFKYFANKDYFESEMAKIADKPGYEEKVKAGLAITGVDSAEQTEEQFVGKFVSHIPGVAASERAYTGLLSKFRDEVYDAIANKQIDKGADLTAQGRKDVAEFINTATGRGNLPQWMEKHGPTLQAALFSPRMWASRLQMLNPQYYAKLSPVARTYALQSAATFAGTAAAVLGLAKMAGGEVETDPHSSDFLKVKFGNTRYDILGGFQQNLVFAAREWDGQSKSSTTGATTQFAKSVPDMLTGNPNAPDLSTSPFKGNRLTKLFDLAGSKSAPMVAAAGHFISGEGIGGTKLDPMAELTNLITPMSVGGAVQTANDAHDLSLSDVPGSAKALGVGALKNAPDIFGISTNTYGDVPTKYQPDNLAKNSDVKVPDAVQKVLDKKAEAARVEDFKKRDIPENQAGVDQRFQNNQFDKAIEGIKHLEDVANKKEELSVTDKDKYELQINRAQTMKDKGIKYAEFADYNKTTLSEWRSMGNPKSDSYDPDTYQKLFELDQAFTAGKASDNSKDPTKPKFFAKAVGSGGGSGSRGGSGSSVKSNTIGNLPSFAKVSLGNLAPQKITTAAKIPTIAQVQPGELIKKRAITVGKA